MSEHPALPRVPCLYLRLATLGLTFLVLAFAQPAEADDQSGADLRARIDSLRTEARYAEARDAARDLIDLLNADPKAKPSAIGDAERLRDHLAHITELPTQAQRELVRADWLDAPIDSLMNVAGSYGEAMMLARDQLEIRRRLLGPANIDVVESMMSVAALLYYTGDYPAAADAFAERVHVARQVFGEEHSQVAGALGDYAFGLQHAGRLDEAEQVLRESIAMKRRTAAEPQSVAIGLNNLGTLLFDRGDIVGAEPLFREALEIWRAELGNDHRYVTRALNNIAAVLKNRGNLDAAEPLYQEALAIRRRTLSENHPDIATSLANLANLMDRRGAHHEAENLHREALRIRRTALGDGHFDVSNSLGNLAHTLEELDRSGEAEAMYREMLALRRRTLPEGHVEIALALHQLGGLLSRSESGAEAEALLREAVEIRTSALGERHPDLAASLLLLARVRRDDGDLSETRSLLAEACRVYDAARQRAGYGIERATFQTSPWPEMAAVHLAMGETEDAWRALEKSLARSLADLLREAEARELTGVEAAEEDSLRDAIVRSRDKFRVFEESGDESTGRSRDEARDALLALESQWSTMQQELARRHPVSEGSALSLDRVQRSLPERTAMVGWLDVTLDGVPHAAAW